ncbi:MAG: hypothetical protein ACXAB4_02085 [Candidatus Hodarchaeales archaeon]|jgi:hypothetical protein
MANEKKTSRSEIPQDERDAPDLAEIIDRFYQQVHTYLKNNLTEDLLTDQIEIDAEVSPTFELEISISIQADISPFSPITNCQPILDEAANHAFAVLEPQITKWQTSMRQKEL